LRWSAEGAASCRCATRPRGGRATHMTLVCNQRSLRSVGLAEILRFPLRRRGSLFLRAEAEEDFRGEGELAGVDPFVFGVGLLDGAGAEDESRDAGDGEP
jgi:hypothetical protein